MFFNFSLSLKSRFFKIPGSETIAPAGEIWSVVMLSPNIASILAFIISFRGFSSKEKSLNHGGSLIYVDFGSNS